MSLRRRASRSGFRRGVGVDSPRPVVHVDESLLSEAPDEPPFPWLRILGILLIVFILLSWRSMDLGITWDEPEHFRAARAVSETLVVSRSQLFGGNVAAAVGTFARSQAWMIHPETPMLPRYVQGKLLLYLGKILGESGACRAGSAFAWVLMLFFVFRLAWEVYGSAAAWVSLVVALGFPRLVGHGMIGATESVFVATWWAAVYAYFSAVRRGRHYWVFGLVLGLALMSKFQSLSLLAALSLWGYFYRPARAIRLLLWGLLLSPLVFLALQPLYWSDTIDRVAYFIKFHFQHFPIPLHFLGRGWGLHAPWYYSPLILAATIPLPYLLAALAGAVKGLIAMDRKQILILWMAWVPLFLMMFPQAPTYDGERLFVQAYPAWVLLAAGGLKILWTQKPAWSQAVILAASSFTLFTLATTHPLYLAYYGGSVGGPRGALRMGLESSYWLDAITPGMIEAINREVPPNAKVQCVSVQIDVMHYRQWKGSLRKDIEFVTNGVPGATHVLVYARQGFIDPRAFRELKAVHEVAFHGVPLVKLARLSP